MHIEGLLDGQSAELSDNQLQSLQRQLRAVVQQAKTLGKACNISVPQEPEYRTNEQGELVLPQYRAHINYNQEFWKKYLKNQINFAIITDLSDKVNAFQDKLKDVQALADEYQKIKKIKNTKKNRRLDIQIEKKFECPYDSCYRIYGSDVSLNLHIKLKHKGGNKTDREKLAEEICLAQAKGLTLPQMRFNLPTGYLQQYRQMFQNKIKGDKQNWIALSKT